MTMRTHHYIVRPLCSLTPIQHPLFFFFALHLPNPIVSLPLSSSSYPWVLIFWQNVSSPCCEVMIIESKYRITLAGPGPAYLTRREAEERLRLAMIHWWVSLADVAVYSLLLHTSVLHYTMHFTRTRARMIHTHTLTHTYTRAHNSCGKDSNASLSHLPRTPVLGRMPI